MILSRFPMPEESEYPLSVKPLELQEALAESLRRNRVFLSVRRASKRESSSRERLFRAAETRSLNAVLTGEVLKAECAFRGKNDLTPLAYLLNATLLGAPLGHGVKYKTWEAEMKVRVELLSVPGERTLFGESFSSLQWRSFSLFNEMNEMEAGKNLIRRELTPPTLQGVVAEITRGLSRSLR